MLPHQLLSWRKGLGLTQAQAAIKLGISLRAFIYYEKGEREMPKPVSLLLWALTRAKEMDAKAS